MVLLQFLRDKTSILEQNLKIWNMTSNRIRLEMFFCFTSVPSRILRTGLRIFKVFVIQIDLQL